MVFVLSRARDKGILSLFEESHIRPADSAFWCYTTEPQELHGEQGPLRWMQCAGRVSYMNFVVGLAYYLLWSLCGRASERRTRKSEVRFLTRSTLVTRRRNIFFKEKIYLSSISNPTSEQQIRLQNDILRNAFLVEILSLYDILSHSAYDKDSVAVAVL